MTLQLHTHGFLVDDFLTPPVHEYAGPLLAAQAEGYSRLLEAAKKGLFKIDNDQGLLPQGKVKRRNAVILTTLKEIAQQSTDRRRKLDQDLKRAREALPTRVPRPTPSELDPAVLEIRLQEIRADLKQIPELERVAALSQAAEAGDRLPMLAIEGASSISRLLSEDDLDKARQAFLEVIFPEKFEKLATVEQAMRDFLFNIRMARNAVALAAGTQPSGLPPMDDDIADRATS